MKTALVIGTNRGIGLELCRQLKAQGFSVTAVCRTASEALKVLKVDIIEGVDVGQDDSIKGLRQALGESRPFDVVINNAGILESNRLDCLDFASIQRQFQVNALGPLRIMEAAKDLLGQGSKVIMVTSRMGSVADNTSGSCYGYRMSKAALNIASVSLAHDLKPKGVAVGIVHPGYVKTDMTSHTGNIEPEESARGILARLEELNLDTSGTFWHANGEVLPW